MRSVLRRTALSAAAALLLGGATLTLAVASGRLEINAKAPIRAQGPKPLAIAGFAPGDSAERTIVVKNQTRAPIRRLGFTLDERRTWTVGKVVAAPRGRTTPPGRRWERSCVPTVKARRKVRRCTTRLRPLPSPLITDPSGLVATLDVCSKPWRRQPATVPRYTCPAKRRTLVRAKRLPIRTTIRGLPANRPGAGLYFRMTIALPPGAGNNLQGVAVTLAPTFTAGGLR